MNIEATIIVMVYKNLNQVIQTLDSIKKQTYSNYEVIVSDDGSPNYIRKKTLIKSLNSIKMNLRTLNL